MAKITRELTAVDVTIAEEALLDFQFAVISAMNEKKITQSELAEKLGISRGRMSQILSSDANPTLKLVGRIVAALELETRYVSAAKNSANQQKFQSSSTNAATSGFVTDWASVSWELPARVWHNDNQRSKGTQVRSGPIAA